MENGKQSTEIDITEIATKIKEATIECMGQCGIITFEQAQEFNSKYFLIPVVNNGKVEFRYAKYVT